VEVFTGCEVNLCRWAIYWVCPKSSTSGGGPGEVLPIRGGFSEIVASFSFTWKEDEAKEIAVSRYTLRVVQPDDEAALHAAMRRCPALREFSSLYRYFGESQSCSGAHNLAIAARLASVGALPDSMMLAASTGWCSRSTRKRDRLVAGSDPPEAGKQSARLFPSAPPMLGAGQWENQKLQTILSPLRGGYLRPPALREAHHWFKFEV
jgi:hypothetical protein